MSDYYLQWWNDETKTWEGEKIFPAPGNLAEQYPGGYKFWLRREVADDIIDEEGSVV